MTLPLLSWGILPRNVKCKGVLHIRRPTCKKV